VILPVRIRRDDKWMDATIRNVSPHGMLLQIDDPPPKGSFIEIRKQKIVVVGQVRWQGEDCCGLRTQDRVPVAALMSANSAPERSGSDSALTERRATVRVMTPAEVAERSRQRGAQFQRVALIAAAVAGAMLVASLMFDVLRAPFEVISAKL
jgi:hypothetical protein